MTIKQIITVGVAIICIAIVTYEFYMLQKGPGGKKDD